MPQLDIVTFFSQFFWLCVFYVSFYYLLYKYFLPQYSRCILFRDKFTGSSSKETSLLEEKRNIEESLSNITISAVNFSKKNFQESKTGCSDWHLLCHKKTNDKWKSQSILYIKTFGERRLSTNISNSSISYRAQNLFYASGLSNFCTKYGQKVQNFSNLKISKNIEKSKIKTVSTISPLFSENSKKTEVSTSKEISKKQSPNKNSRQKVSGKKSLKVQKKN